MRDTDEEARAALWRANQQKRRLFVSGRFLEIQRKSDAVEREVMDDWEPVLMAVAENRLSGLGEHNPERGY